MLIRSLTTEEDVSKVYASFENEISRLNDENSHIRLELKAMREQRLSDSLDSAVGVSSSHGDCSFQPTIHQTNFSRNAEERSKQALGC